MHSSSRGSPSTPPQKHTRTGRIRLPIRRCAASSGNGGGARPARTASGGAFVPALPPSLLSFLFGGAAAAGALLAWARGSPLRRNRPYRFTITFTEASKLAVGTPVRMKGVQVGTVVGVALTSGGVAATVEVADGSNVVPASTRADLNLLGIAADPWVDLTPPSGELSTAAAASKTGPHDASCAAAGTLVCAGGVLHGHQGGSTDAMMRFFLKQHDTTRRRDTAPPPLRTGTDRAQRPARTPGLGTRAAGS